MLYIWGDLRNIMHVFQEQTRTFGLGICSCPPNHTCIFITSLSFFKQTVSGHPLMLFTLYERDAVRLWTVKSV